MAQHVEELLAECAELRVEINRLFLVSDELRGRLQLFEELKEQVLAVDSDFDEIAKASMTAPLTGLASDAR